MTTSDSLRGKKPAGVYKDLFYINNSNDGVDGTLRSVFGGNGEETTVKISTEQSEISFNEGKAIRPQIKNASWTWLSHIDISGTNYTLSCLGGNFHKILLSGVLTNLVISDAPSVLLENIVGDITILINAQNIYSITNWPSNTNWSNGVKPNFATQANNGFLLVRLITLDSGNSWYGQILGENLRTAP